MVKLIEKLLGIPEHGDSPRADVMLPNSILYIGLGILVVGFGILVSLIFDFNASLLGAALLVVVFGIYTIIWWRNTTITIIDTNTFKVSSLTGKVRTFRFDEITNYHKIYNNVEIYVGKEKFSIESTALMTQRFRTLLNKQLKKEVF